MGFQQGFAVFLITLVSVTYSQFEKADNSLNYRREVKAGLMRRFLDMVVGGDCGAFGCDDGGIGGGGLWDNNYGNSYDNYNYKSAEDPDYDPQVDSYYYYYYGSGSGYYYYDDDDYINDDNEMVEYDKRNTHFTKKRDLGRRSDEESSGVENSGEKSSDEEYSGYYSDDEDDRRRMLAKQLWIRMVKRHS